MNKNSSTLAMRIGIIGDMLNRAIFVTMVALTLILLPAAFALRSMGIPLFEDGE